MPDEMPEDVPKHMPEDMPEDMPEHLPEDMPGRMPEDMPDRMPENMSDRMPEDLPVTKCINVMVGITRSKVFFVLSGPYPHTVLIHTHTITHTYIYIYIYIAPDNYLERRFGNFSVGTNPLLRTCSANRGRTF